MVFRLIFLVLFSFVIFSCSVKKKQIYTDKQHETWVTLFKEEVFVECLKESYQNDTIFKLISKKDISGSHDFIVWITEIEIARKLGREFADNIPDPEYKFDYKIGQKYYMSSCLKYYASRELDSIAQIEYKKYLKNSVNVP